MIFFLSYEVSEIYFELDWVVMEESNVPYKYFFPYSNAWIKVKLKFILNRVRKIKFHSDILNCWNFNSLKRYWSLISIKFLFS